MGAVLTQTTPPTRAAAHKPPYGGSSSASGVRTPACDGVLGLLCVRESASCGGQHASCFAAVVLAGGIDTRQGRRPWPALAPCAPMHPDAPNAGRLRAACLPPRGMHPCSIARCPLSCNAVSHVSSPVLGQSALELSRVSIMCAVRVGGLARSLLCGPAGNRCLFVVEDVRLDRVCCLTLKQSL